MINGGNGRSFTKTLPKDAIEWDTKSEPVSQFEPLARGKVYHWQVQAITSDGSEFASFANRRFQSCARRLKGAIRSRSTPVCQSP